MIVSRRDVYVLGVGQTFFGKQPELTAMDLAAQAANLAIEDAGIDPRDIERAYCGSVYSPPNIGQTALVRVGISGIPMFTIENACTSGSTAVDTLWREIAMCGCEVGMAVGVESLSAFNRKIGGKGLLGTEGDVNGLQGLSTVSYFAGLANRMMAERGATLEDLAYPAVKNHRNGSKNPLAQYRKVFTTEDILGSAMICDPITALMCCPQSDGAAAIILCSKEYYEKHVVKTSRPMVKVAGSILSNSRPEDVNYDQLEMQNVVRGMKEVCEMAGVGAEDVNVVELHDAFSNEELASYEMFGLCKKGDGVAFARSGAAEIGGKCPVNPSGGLMAMGHPLGASGVRVVNDIAKQLWGESGDNQVEGAKVGVASMLGALLGTLQTSPVAAFQILTK